MREAIDKLPDDDPPVGTLASFITLAVTVVAIYVGLWVHVPTAIAMFGLAIVIVGTDVANTWNQELRSERAAPVDRIRAIYAGVLILSVSLVLPLVELFGGFKQGLAASLAAGAIYALLVYAIALRGVQPSEFQIERSPRTGEMTAYPSERDYIDVVEEIALERKKRDDD